MRRWLYRLRNIRAELGMLRIFVGSRIARMLGVLGGYGTLSIKVFRADGSVEDYGIVGARVVTDAGVAFLVDDWAGDVTDITTMNYHDSGTTNTAENATDTVLAAQAGPTTRATGTKSQPSANVLRSVGTITYTGALAIVEHGLFSQAAQGGTLWDRTVFTAINVIADDSIQFTYDCTLTAGS